MLRNLHPLELLGMLGIVVLLRWQSLQTGFLPETDAAWLQLGRRIAAGAFPYTGTLTHELPLSAWAAGFFYYLFGGAGAWVLRALACVSITALAILARNFYTERKLGTYGYGAALAVGLALCLPWQLQQLRFVVFSLPLGIAVVVLALRCAGQRRPRWSSLAAFGIALGATLLWEAVLWPMAALALFAFVRKDGFRPPALLRIAAGTAVWALVLVVYLWAVSEWRLLEGLVRLPQLWPSELLPTGMELQLLTQPEVFAFVGLPILAGVVGWFRFRTRFFREAVTARKADGLLGMWLVGATLGLFVVWPNEALEHLFLLAPVAGLYGTYLIEHLPREGVGRWLRRMSLTLLVAATAVHIAAPWVWPNRLANRLPVTPPTGLPIVLAGQVVVAPGLSDRAGWKLGIVPGCPTAAADSSAPFALHQLPARGTTLRTQLPLRRYYRALTSLPPTHWYLPPAEEAALRQRFPQVLPHTEGPQVWVGTELCRYYHTPALAAP